MSEHTEQQSMETESAEKQAGALKTSLYSAAVMGAFALILTALMASTYELTRPYISASESEARMRLINDILPPALYNNDLLADYVEIGPVPEIGLDSQGRVYRARLDGKPVALIVPGAATNGYSGRIELVIAMFTDGSLGGIRVVKHKETPGLGDYIDPRKDRNKHAPWVAQFGGQSLQIVPLERWKVRRDGGDFDFRNGATVSARAVTDASGKTLAYAQANRERLFTADTGSSL